VKALDPTEWDDAYAAGEYGTIVMEALTAIVPTFNSPPDYYRPFAAYYMACLYAHRRDFSQAKAYVDAIEFSAPPESTGLLPYDLRVATRLCMYWQERALDAGKPGTILISLPKSASAFLSQNIVRAFDVPLVKIAAGEGLNALAVPKWAAQVA